MIGRVTRRLVCKDISTHCEDLGNDAQLHVTDNWLDTRNENGEKSLILLQISVCLVSLRMRFCRVQFRGERIASRPNSAVTWAWRADESSSGDIILSCERDSFKSFSIISDLRDRWRFRCCECGSKRLLFRPSSKSWAQPSKPRPDKIFGQTDLPRSCSQAWHLLNKLDKPFYVSFIRSCEKSKL